MNDQLFQPSLGSAQPAQPLFSPLACWMTAFFGGPIAALIIFTSNFERAGLLRAERLSLGLAAVLAIGGQFGAIYLGAAMGWEGRDVRLLVRAGALIVAALLYWRLHKAFKAQQLFGTPPASPWVMAIGAIFANIAVAVVAAFMFKDLSGSP